MQIFEHLHIFKHFKSEGYIDFLENVSVTFIDKTDLQNYNFWIHTFKTMVCCLNNTSWFPQF